MKQQDINRATDIIDAAFEIINEVAEAYMLHEECVMNALLQSHFDDNFGLLDADTSDEVTEMVLEMFADANIPYMACGTYRILFHFDDLVMKVNRHNLYKGSGVYAGENEEEMEKWEKFSGTEAEKYILPVLDHFQHHSLGEVIFVPYAETIEEHTYQLVWKYFYDRNTEAGIALGLNEVMEDEQLTTEEKDFCLQYCVLSPGFSDDHHGNWGFYKGNLVCIDFGSYDVTYTSQTKIMKIMKKYREKLGVCHG